MQGCMEKYPTLYNKDLGDDEDNVMDRKDDKIDDKPATEEKK